MIGTPDAHLSDGKWKNNISIRTLVIVKIIAAVRAHTCGFAHAAR